MITLAAEHTKSTVTTNDGTQIYYKDWGKGPVVTFSHGWPLNADAWDGQMLFLAQNGFRVIAHDRRGHGRSSQASSGNDMNGYADDLAAVIEALDLEHGYNERWNDDLLQGLGQGPSRYVFARLALECRRVGWTNVLPREQRLPRGRARSTRPRPVQPGLIRK